MKAVAGKFEAQRLEAIQRYNQQMMVQREWLHQQRMRQIEMIKEYQLQQQQRALERRFQVFIKNSVSGF